jgi:hypothetical protein
MKRDEINELHYITPIVNVPSILSYGIMSHNRVKRIAHRSVAMEEIQERRSTKRVPNGLALHEYANCYFCARNPMLFKRKNEHGMLCVLRINPSVFDIPDTVVTDQNAASDYAGFWEPPEGLKYVEKEFVFAETWTHHDQIEEWRRKSRKCAEVLVPYGVRAEYIIGAYVSCNSARIELSRLAPTLSVTLNPHLFFVD